MLMFLLGTVFGCSIGIVVAALANASRKREDIDDVIQSPDSCTESENEEISKNNPKQCL